MYATPRGLLASVLVTALLHGCGPPPVAVDSADDEAETASQHKASMIAQQQKREYLVDQYNGLINTVNEAISELESERFFTLMTDETAHLFILLAEMDLALAGIHDTDPSEHVVQQQKDFDVVYTLEEIDTEESSATLVGVMRDSGTEARFPVKFVESDGGLVLDYTAVLEKRVKNMTKVLVEQLARRVNDSVMEDDAEAFAAAFTPGSLETCPDPLGLGASDPAELFSSLKVEKIVLGKAYVDAADMHATLGYTKDGSEAGTIETMLVVDGGDMHLDVSSACASGE